MASARHGHPELRRPESREKAYAPESRRSARAEFHIPSLDGIRAFSFLIVFVAHAGFKNVIPGGFGVTVFFFLSGFLITTLLRMEHERTADVSLKHFYLRRVLRILPPFYTVLLLAIGVHAAVHVSPLWPEAIAAQFAHFTNYWIIHAPDRGPPEGTEVYWSLAVEEHFYLLFPWLFLGMQRWWPKNGRRQGALLLILCALVLLWRLLLILVWQAPGTRTYYGSDTRIDSILFGCALAVAANPMLERLPGSRRAWRAAAFPLGLAGLLLSFVYRAEWFRDTARYSLQGLALVPIFVVAMREPAWGVFRVLNWRWVRHVGVLSYSLYLIHVVVINALSVTTPLAKIPRAFVALAISLVLAEAIHRWIERPCARWRRKLEVVKTAANEDSAPAGATAPAAAPGLAPRCVEGGGGA